MQYLGIDWSYRRAAWCALDQSGGLVGEGAVPADEGGLADRVPAQVCEKELKRLEVEEARRELDAGDEDDRPTLIVIEAGQPPVRVPNQAGVLQDIDSQEHYARLVRRLQRSPLEISELSIRRPKSGELPPGEDGTR